MKSAPLGCQSCKYVLGVHSQAQAEVGMEANVGHRIQLDRDFGESGADSGLDAPENPDAGVDAGADGRGNVSKPPPPPPPPVLLLLLVRTCHYQRKDSPVEALTLSPEPLGGDRGGKTERGKKAGKGRNTRKYKGEERKEPAKREEMKSGKHFMC